MGKKWPILLFELLAIAALLLICFYGCSPQQKLNRLHSQHPELFKTDTVYSTRTFTVPGFSKDTFVVQNTDLSGLQAALNQSGLKIDSLSRAMLAQKIGAYILQRNCLSDTLKVPTDAGWVKVWQAGGHFNYQHREQTRKIQVSVPMFIYRPEITHKYSWPLFFIGLAAGLLILSLLIIYLRNKQ